MRSQKGAAWKKRDTKMGVWGTGSGGAGVLPKLTGGGKPRPCRLRRVANCQKRDLEKMGQCRFARRRFAQRFGCKFSDYGFGFSEAGFSSAVLAAVVLGFAAAAAITVFRCQKSAATLTISSAGLLSSGEKR